MKLLFDHNLSPRLVSQLADLFPNSTHVHSLGLDQAPDKENGHLIVSRDADLSDLSV